MRRATPTRRLAWLLVAAVAAGAAVLTAAPAWADAGLVSTSPANGTTVAGAPAAVTLTFNEPVRNDLATVTVTAAGGPVSVGKPTAERTIVTQPLPASLPSGEYTVAYRIVSADGHPVSGSVRFTVTAPSPSVPATASPGAARTTAAPAVTAASGAPPLAEGGAGGRTWPWVLAVGVLVLAVTAGLVARARRRRAG